MDLQNQLGQGPCLDALRDHKQIHVPDVEHELRWPSLAAQASSLGVRSILCTPLDVAGRSLGVLTVTGADPDFGDPDRDTAATMRVLAAHAGLALDTAHRLTGLNAALTGRDVIGQAKGILMERFALTPDAAFTLLKRTSSHTNTKLRDVCEQLRRTGTLTR